MFPLEASDSMHGIGDVDLAQAITCMRPMLVKNAEDAIAESWPPSDVHSGVIDQLGLIYFALDRRIAATSCGSMAHIGHFAECLDSIP